MRILFLFKLENFMAPIGLAQISAVANAAGHETYLCEMNSEGYMDAVERVQPQVVAVSTMTGEAKHYIAAVDEIKRMRPEIFCLAGGIHPTVYPQMVIDTAFDAVCVGEGEGAFVDVLECLEGGGQIYDIGQIKNICTKDSPNTEVRPLVDDLDTLPHPDWDLIYENTRLGDTPMKNFMTGRGCPFNCTYCWNANIKDLYSGKGQLVRKNSVDYVIEGLKRIKDKYPLTTVKFYDDMLIWKDDAWAEEFRYRYREEIGLPFFAFCRAELATESVIQVLAAAGCRTLSMSIEAGNDSVRRDMLNRKMTNRQIVDAHLLAKEYGIKTFTNVILGIPDTTKANDVESMDLAIASKVDWIENLIFEPYPGTWLGNYCINKGYYDPDYAAMHSGYHHKSPLSCFTEEEKRVQLNMTTIGVVAIALRWKWLRDLTVNRLVYWRPNKLFLMMYFVVKMYVIRHKLYVTKTKWWKSVGIYLRSLKQELFKHSEEDD